MQKMAKMQKGKFAERQNRYAGLPFLFLTKSEELGSRNSLILLNGSKTLRKV